MEQINDLEGLANYFHGLADGSIEPFKERVGICYNIGILIEECILANFMDEWERLLHIENYYSGWSHFSGDTQYPVPDPSGGLTPEQVYRGRTPKWKGAYGDLRKDLCRHIAKEIEVLIEVN